MEVRAKNKISLEKNNYIFYKKKNILDHLDLIKYINNFIYFLPLIYKNSKENF
jgi:hypothetical protein